MSFRALAKYRKNLQTLSNLLAGSPPPPRHHHLLALALGAVPRFVFIFIFRCYGLLREKAVLFPARGINTVWLFSLESKRRSFAVEFRRFTSRIRTAAKQTNQGWFKADPSSLTAISLPSPCVCVCVSTPVWPCVNTHYYFALFVCF